MKKIIKFLPAMAILLASGLAVATTSKTSEYNVKNVNLEEGDPHWEPLLPGETIDCDGNTRRECKAFRDGSNISNVAYGFQL